MSETPVLGIDFGTSNTAAAWVDAQQRVRVVPVREGVYLLPSMAWYSERGGSLVGDAARQQLVEDPVHTIHGLKRFIGRRWTSPFVHRHKDHFGYRMVEGDDGLVAVDLFGRSRSLEDVATDILKRMVELASASVRAPVTECTLTVPAHYGFSQRQSIRAAAAKAGLSVKAMVNEPTAAAMYYARKKGNDGTVLIFDLGGGTFDATLLAVMGGIVKVIATGGDAFLGGQDFDGRVVEHLAARFERDHGVDLRPQTVALWRLFVAAETAKVTLSTEEQARVHVPCVTVKDDRFLDLDYVVTRRELEALTAPLIERCLGICEELLSRARMTPKDVAEIVFVGGQTRMPAIQRRLAQIFRSNPAKHIHPDLGVAVGAALLARGDQSLIDVVSAPLGVMVPGVGARELIPANTTVPSVKRLPLGMRPSKGQPLIMAIFESPDATSLEREHLGTTRADAAWLDKNEGDLELEAWMGDDLSLTLSLKAAGGGRLPLVIERPQDLAASTSNGISRTELATAPDPADPTRPARNKPQHVEDAETNVDPPGAPAAHRHKLSASVRKGLVPPGFKSIDVGFASETSSHGLDASQRARESRMVAPFASSSSPSSPSTPNRRAPGESTGGVGAAGDEEGNVPRPGDRVGKYRLLDVIGTGGMGRVYLAEHTVLGRKVALKMLRRRFSDNRQAVERFITEARAVNQIHHENIIQITDFFESDDGHTCYIMELLEGQSVAELLADVRVPALEDALAIAFQVADAMVAVHDAQIVHRDIKPENIFLTRRDGIERFVKLLDFGVAKLVDDPGRSLQETGLGEAPGTPEYMSPEQLVRGRVDHRSDIYALGVVLYEMLTGQKPFDLDGSNGEALFQQLTQAPVPPSRRRQAPLPAALEELVMQCLEREPSRRPRSMREVRGRLEAFLEQRQATQRTTRLLKPLSSSSDGPAASDTQLLAADASSDEDFEPKTVITDPASLDLVLLPGEILRPEVTVTSPQPQPQPEPTVIAENPLVAAPGPEAPAPAVPRPQSPARPAPRRPSPLAVGGGAFVGAVIVLSFFVGFLLTREEPDASDEVKVSVASAPKAASSSASGTDRGAAVPTRVRITFESTPPGAGVYLPGRDRRLGVTPFSVEVQPSRAAQDFEFRLAGHATRVETMQPPTGDTRVHVTLEPLR